MKHSYRIVLLLVITASLVILGAVLGRVTGTGGDGGTGLAAATPTMAPVQTADASAPGEALVPPVQTDADREDLISGHGFDAAPASLASALAATPFHPQVPSAVPSGYRLWDVLEAHVRGNPDSGRLSLSYMSVDPDTGLFNDLTVLELRAPRRPYDKPAFETSGIEKYGVIQVGPGPWDYAIAVYPQPDGSVVRRVEISRTTPDGVSTWIAMDVVTDVDAALRDLTAVAASIP